MKVPGIPGWARCATIKGVNSLVLRTALLTGLLIGAVNIGFSGWQYGFDHLPVWFYLSQLLLLPAMLIPMQVFPQAAATKNYMQRAALYCLGWAVPYAVYRFSGDALSLSFDPVSSLTTYLITVIVFGLIFAAIRAPTAPK